MDDPIPMEPLDESATFIKEMKESKQDLKKCIAIANALLEEEDAQGNIDQDGDGQRPDTKAGVIAAKSTEVIARSVKTVEDSHQLIDSAGEISKRDKNEGPR